ncbi:MAG: heat-inducible transcriptional repressor HrcA [Atribacterota bacterium]|jgi:heat-inducible transcriptional repressor|nr:heat-inducible transcriptional repressor HrcA [Atribacterota bacterium]MDY0382721.1 heat-inducible transcriptional repressor HrcA [Atribacterota bacterium]
MSINDRINTILNAVVHLYITKAEPVSSEMIVAYYGLSISTATVRNDLQLLEKQGFLMKPHTSAGRIPTDKGYRYYVDQLMEKEVVHLSEEEKEEVREQYKIVRDYNEIMKVTSILISRLTHNLGVVLAPNMIKDTLKDIHFVTLDNQRILVTLVTNSGLFFQKMMKVNCTISDENLEAISQIIKKEFYGKSLEVVNDEMLNQIYHYYFKYQTLDSIWKLMEECFDFTEDETRLFLGNRSYILKQPEFKEIEKLNYFFDFIEEEENLIKIMRKPILENQIDIIIGSELGQDVMEDCSVITRQYLLKGKLRGAISVLGPTRMNYSKSVSVLDFIAEQLSEILSE